MNCITLHWMYQHQYELLLKIFIVNCLKCKSYLVLEFHVQSVFNYSCICNGFKGFKYTRYCWYTVIELKIGNNTFTYMHQMFDRCSCQEWGLQQQKYEDELEEINHESINISMFHGILPLYKNIVNFSPCKMQPEMNNNNYI